MRIVFTLVAVFVLVGRAGATVEEGTVAAIDGKGGFQVAIKGVVIDFEATSAVLQDDPSRRTPRFPSAYKDLRVGDYVEIRRGGKKVSGIRIIKRGAAPVPQPDPDE